MLVEPSHYRSDWVNRSAMESETQIDDYAASAGAARQQVRATSAQEPGDPTRAAQAILDAVASGYPPHHLLLAADAFEEDTTQDLFNDLDSAPRRAHAA